MNQPPKNCWVDRVSVERLITDQWGSAPLNRGNPKVPRKVMSLSSGSKGPIMCRIRRIRSPGWEGPGKLITAWLDRSTRMATAPKRRMRDA